MKINSKTTLIVALVLSAVFITYFSTEPSYEVKEVIKEIQLVGAKKSPILSANI